MFPFPLKNEPTSSFFMLSGNFLSRPSSLSKFQSILLSVSPTRNQSRLKLPFAALVGQSEIA